MTYLPQVVRARHIRHIRNFIIPTRFDDGTEKHIDVSQWSKGPVFEPLKDPKLFKKFFVEGGTLAWPSGVDIAPEALYAARDLKRRKDLTKEKSERQNPIGYPSVNLGRATA